MKKIVHKAESRGHANHGWLDTHHTFSFAHYYHPERNGFGVLRVLNDDVVDGGMGFGTHPHQNMEIISIPLSGDLEHKDSMGNTFVIKENDVQVMSAGKGVYHSEYNHSKDKKVNFLQIWVIPNKQNVEPRYDQQTFDPAKRINTWQQVVSPSPSDEGVWIHQEAWFHLTMLETGKSISYPTKRKETGIYTFVIEGEVEVNGETLQKRDGLGITEIKELTYKAKQNAELLVMEVPLNK